MVFKKRNLSQVFLKNRRYIHRIIDAIDITGKNVFEVGPGEGIITEALAEKAHHLWALDIDERFVKLLNDKFHQTKNISIIRNNILCFDLETLPEKLVLFSNVPYHISTEFIEYLIHYHHRIEKAYLLLQKEFVDKLTASVGNRQYGFLTCVSAYYSEVKVLFSVPRRAFLPVPSVHSKFICMDFSKKTLFDPAEEKKFVQLLRLCFSCPRKTLFNGLRPVYPQDGLISAFECVDVSRVMRPHQISLQKYHQLMQEIQLIDSGNRK